jgi:hypothetical protein
MVRRPAPLIAFVRLVKERFGIGVFSDGGIDLLAGHAFLYFRVVGNRFLPPKL